MKYSFLRAMWSVLFAVTLTVGVGATVYASPIQATKAEKQEKQEEDEDEEEKEEVDQDGLTIADRYEILREVRQDEGAEAELDELRGIHEDFPKHLPTGVDLLNRTQSLGMESSREERESANELFYESGKIARKLVKLDDFPAGLYNLAGTAIYNEACTLALDGKDKEAMKVLAESFKYGFEDFEHALQDSDFGELLETDEYKKIVKDGRESAKELKKVIAKKVVAQAVKQMDEFKSFDFDFEVVNTDGDEITKDTFAGKILIVNLWGTTNGASLEEIPELVKLKKKFKDEIEVLGLAFERGDDDDDKMETVVEFMEENDVNYECALATREVLQSIRGLRTLPSSLVIDGKGDVRLLLSGASSKEVLEAVTQKLLDE